MKLSPSELGLADELAARLGISRATVLRRALLAVAQHPHLVANPSKADFVRKKPEMPVSKIRALAKEQGLVSDDDED